MTTSERVSFPCPFCGLTASAGRHGAEPALLHASPPCAGFADIGLVSYLEQAMAAIRKSTN